MNTTASVHTLDIIVSRLVVTTYTTGADWNAMTADAILGGLILRDPAGGARADYMPTVDALIVAMNARGVQVADGDCIEFTIRNTADAAETITVTTNTGWTLSGTMTIAQNNTKRFLAVITSAASKTATLYSLGTVVH